LWLKSTFTGAAGLAGAATVGDSLQNASDSKPNDKITLRFRRAWCMATYWSLSVMKPTPYWNMSDQIWRRYSPIEIASGG
jgi:hypothetical protein